ncbi:endonuclease/exonuclease/phosphatase family protein [Nocardioides aestuarii]|uniref:Endonuclease/exonuclease/phosphatase family protein n=1 Tax=Nocardioides aestuarii TaxID=252231 RepID=A0ABW4TLV2_9ACTN
MRPEGDELHVMSFNLRFASDTPPHSWPERRPLVADLLRREAPHVLGTQEGLHDQLDDVRSDLPGHYDDIGQGRDGGTAGEAMQVFFDTRRLRAVEHRHYWLSDTPEVAGSETWGGSCPRMVTWVRFEDRRTGGQLYLVNTHLEAFGTRARERGAALLRQRTSDDLDPALPVVVTGDFNEPAAPTSPAYDALVTRGPFVDTWVEAEERGPDLGTFHDWQPPTPGGDRIDWILTTPGVRTTHAVANAYERDGDRPSDHLPVQALLELPQAKRS